MQTTTIGIRKQSRNTASTGSPAAYPEEEQYVEELRASRMLLPWRVVSRGIIDALYKA